MILSDALTHIRPFVARNSTSILTGISVIGTVTTAVLAAKATPTAMRLIEHEETVRQEQLRPVEKIKVCWKLYIPATLTCSTTVACTIFANSISLNRNALLAGAYTLSEAAAREYKNKVLENVGEKKEKKIREEVAQERISSHPVSQSSLVIAGVGDSLCYDIWSDRYFMSDIETLRKIENTLNRRLMIENEVTLNELYSELGIGHTKMGDNMGWVSDNLIEFDFTATIADNGKPCIVLDYKCDPELQILRRSRGW